MYLVDGPVEGLTRFHLTTEIEADLRKYFEMTKDPAITAIEFTITVEIEIDIKDMYAFARIDFEGNYRIIAYVIDNDDEDLTFQSAEYNLEKHHATN